ncbi:STAS domain-containing protein [Tautonia rosea]|uniref:STAS domain-containing protein n=1 Tax=Tautonia rosea TaxID=2728037 RepID=UPI00147333A1|nr:STAS domain-containing protein [Tautonia rosea]
MNAAPAGSVEGTYRVIERDGFVEIELLTPKLPEELGAALIDEAMVRRWSCLVLDCSQVEFLSSLGLGALIRLDRQLRPTGGRLKLCGLNPHLREFFAITRLDRVLQISDSEPDALETSR